MLWELLIQFVFRLFLGLAATMTLTSPKDVDANFFRVHLWVLLGLGTFGSLVAVSSKSLFVQSDIVIGLSITVTVLSYLGSIIWLYQRVRLGMGVLVGIALLSFGLLMYVHPSKLDGGSVWNIWLAIDVLSGSMILGTTFAAMLLGHWYLNSPTMKLDPLRWLLILMVVSIVARIALSAGGFAIHYAQSDFTHGFIWAATAMRWLAGLLGLAGMTWMTWQTLKIPNTQSATGILYVALVFVFLGELAAAIVGFNSVVPY